MAFLIVYVVFIVLTGWARERRGGQFLVGALLGILLGPLLGLIVALLLPPTKGERKQRAEADV
jgi:NhaP-type Na+/H+ or K+/H+ antiporter